MNAVGRIGSYISRGVYTVSGPFHPFGGAVDIIVVEQPDGSFKSSPWYVRFGKFQGVLKTKEKVVSISVNGVEANFHMYLDHKGEAYFLKDVDAGEGNSVLYPSSSSDETDGLSNNDRRVMKSKSCNYDDKQLNSPDQIDSSSKKIVSRTRSGSRRARFLGLVFGGRSMKKDGFREAEVDAGIERLNSLERAEIAADLLEVKWSTNLASSKSRKGNASRFSAPDVVDDKVDKDNEVEVESSVNDDGKSRTDYSVPPKEIDSPNEEMASCFLSSSESLQSAVVEASIEISCTDTMEQVETSRLGESVLVTNGEIVCEISTMTDKVDVGNADRACPDSAKQFNVEEACDEKDVKSPGCGSSEESGSDRVQPFVYCEASESSMVLWDGSDKQIQETLSVASGGCGEVHVVDTLHVNSELLSKDTNAEKAKHNGLEKELAEVYDNCSDNMNPATCRLDYNETDFDESLTVPECGAQVVGIDPALCATEEVVMQSICTTQGDSPDVQDGTNIVDDLHQPLNIGDYENFNGDSGQSKAASNSTSESSEEEQFLFGDLDEYKCNEVQCMDSSSPDCSKRYNDREYSVESIKEVHGPVYANDESRCSSDMFIQHNRLTDPENLMEKSRVLSSPISIPISHMAEVERLAESLPNMWSPTSDLSADDCHCPLSHSLDSNSESLKWTLLKENDSSCMKSDVDKEQQLQQERPNIDNSQISQELKIVHSNPTVEISLCKHLLYEGMGANAASEAFDAEKLDIDKYTSLSPAVLKNDRLVVRIDGHYFPWNVAAPFVLGMVAFGIKEIFEPKGMILVDRVEKSVIGDPSKTIVSSGGSWLWPFTFRRSRSRKAMQPARSDTEISDAEFASNSIKGGDEEKNVCKPKMAKKIIRAITPTSEELASLNLKEGRNTVTFTFFTPMLGKQQVDARIYLWKWNTRIVISDVDGTITKSDVLGQFMPLVGVDWSQTGVAHLFSAIKENGYQLLFLSARAISQAYHTRQFLFNLKQDGKALPDGPVVISPDGLFPSLFREVIRRAPHEFKIACLEDIRALFPADCNPFYAGFGNRDTDEFSYLKVGIPRGKIFIINPKGEVAVSRRVDTKSYSSLHALVHGMFPSTTSTEQEDFNTWNYWKLPPPDIDV